MITHPAYAPGDPCWIDLMTDSMDRAAAFYGALFGWTFQDVGAEFGHYHMLMLDDVAVGGAMQNSDAATGMPEDMLPEALGNYWTVYLDTPDIHALVARAQDAGGTSAFDPMPVGSLGWQGQILHPTLGAPGVWQPVDFAGTGRLGAPGFPVWFELHTPAFDEALDVLREIFAWDVAMMADTPQFRYAQQHAGGQARAGVYDLAPESAASGGRPGAGADQPPTWFIYFDVADIGAALSTAADLGGAVLEDAEDTPFGLLAEVADPLGARFKLSQDTGRAAS